MTESCQIPFAIGMLHTDTKTFKNYWNRVLTTNFIVRDVRQKSITLSLLPVFSLALKAGIVGM